MLNEKMMGVKKALMEMQVNGTESIIGEDNKDVLADRFSSEFDPGKGGRESWLIYCIVGHDEEGDEFGCPISGEQRMFYDIDAAVNFIAKFLGYEEEV